MLLNFKKRYLTNFSGIVALLLSNVFLCIALIVLRSSSSDPYQKTTILAIANIFATSTIFLPHKGHKNRKENYTFKSWLYVAGWSFSYCVGYTLFLSFPGYLGLGQLIICESLAPALATWISGDIFKKHNSSTYTFIKLSPIILLLFLGYIKWPRSYANTTDWFYLVLMFSVFVTFLTSQTFARKLAEIRSSRWIQSRFTFLNSIGLILFLVSIRPHTSIQFTMTEISSSVAVAALIIAMQWLYVEGLKTTEAVLAALMISTTVPISILSEILFEGAHIEPIELGLGITYCFATVVVKLFRKKPNFEAFKNNFISSFRKNSL